MDTNAIIAMLKYAQLECAKLYVYAILQGMPEQDDPAHMKIQRFIDSIED